MAMSENATLQLLDQGTSTMPTEWPQDKYIPLPEKEKIRLSSLIRWEKELPEELKTLEPPCDVSIGSLLDSRLRLRIPVTLKLEQENDFYIARLDELEEFGYGYTATQAIDDFRQTLAELYWTLREEQSRLSQDLAELWNKLNQIIEVI
jgi:hypothetical protein